MLKVAERYDHATLQMPPEVLLQFLTTADGVKLGDGGVAFLSPAVPGNQAMAHIYIWDPLWRGRYDLVRQLMAFKFQQHGFHRIGAAVPSRHTRALAFAKRVGFREEGKIRRGILYNEGVDDCVILGVLPDEV